MSGQRRVAPRDQLKSPFALILDDLMEACPFARGAALVDFEGETVDYAGALDPFELRVTAATFQLIRTDFAQLVALGVPHTAAIAMRRAGYVVRVIDAHYSLVIIVRSLATFSVGERTLTDVSRRIAEEAGLSLPTQRWFRVDTVGGSAARPDGLRAPDDHGAWHPIEVIGGMRGLLPREQGFRVRLPSKAEVSLVREPNRRWFIDEDPRGVL